MASWHTPAASMARPETLEERAQKAWAFAYKRGMIQALENRRDREWEIIASLSPDDRFFPLGERQGMGSHPPGWHFGGLCQEKSLSADFKTGQGSLEGQASFEGLWSELESELMALARRRGQSPGEKKPRAQASPPSTGKANSKPAKAIGPDAAPVSSSTELLSPLTELRDDIGRLAAELDAMRQEAARRDNVLRTEAERIADIGQFRKEISDLTCLLGTFAPLSALRELDHDIKAIAERFEKLSKGEAEASPMLRLRQQLHEIRELVTAMASLAENTARQRTVPDIGTLPGALNDPARVESLQKVETQIEVLGQRVDAAIAQAEISGQYAALAQQIEAVKQQLTARIDANATISVPHTQQLEQLVRVLAQKMESLPDPKSNEQAIEVLQSELVRIDGRLDQNDKTAASLSSIETTITRLSAEMGLMKGSLPQTVEAAARQVIQELRQASPSDPLFSAGAEQDIEKRFERIETMIREGLESFTSRLERLETSMSGPRGADTQPAPLRSFLHLGSTPLFAPAGEGRPEATQTLNVSPDKPAGKPAVTKEREQNRSLQDPLEDSWPFAGTAQQKNYAVSPDSQPVLTPGPMSPASVWRAAEDELLEPGSGFPLLSRLNSAREAANSAASVSMNLEGRTASALKMPPAVGRLAAIALEQQATEAKQEKYEHKTLRHRWGWLLKPFKRFIRRRSILFSLAGLLMLAALGGLIHAATGIRHSAEMSKDNSSSSGVPASAVKTASTSLEQKSSLAKAGSENAAKPPFTPAEAQRLTRLAESGNAAAQYRLALLLQEGTAHAGGDDPAADLKAAASWYKKAADQGLVPAYYRLGMLYEKGLGVSRDPAQAAEFYRQAAEQGNTRAMHNLAVLSAEPENGPPDYASAVAWFTKAADYGLRDSQYNCAILLARGLGAPRNLTKAYAWFAIAAAQGDEEAARKRDEVEHHLSAEEIGAAKTIVANFQPQPAKTAANEVPMPSGDEEKATRQAEAAKPTVSSLCEEGHMFANIRSACFH